MNFFLCKILLFLQEKKNMKQAAANNFAVLSYQFIYSNFLFLGKRSGKQLWKHWTEIRFPDGRQFVFQLSLW